MLVKIYPMPIHIMLSQIYSSPVNQLFRQDDPDLIQDWSHYLTLGITVADIEQLAKLSIDRSLIDAEEDAGWA